MKTNIIASIIWQFVIVTIAQFPPPGPFAIPQMPGLMPGSMQMQIPFGAIPNMSPHPTMNLNSPFQMPQPRFPAVVSPFHSKASDRKYRRRKNIKKMYLSSSSSSSESSSSSKEFEFRSKKQEHKGRRKQRRQILTPVISYVTRNGDVVYQKKVKKDKAGDWLELGKRRNPIKSSKARKNLELDNSQEMTVRDLKHKFDIKSNRHKHKH